MTGPSGWGRHAGHRVRQALLAKLGASDPPSVVRLSLAGVSQVDVTFAAEAIVASAKHRLPHHALCLADPANDDVVENISAAALVANIPLWLWRGDQPQALGPRPSGALVTVLTWAMARPQVRVSALAQALDLSIPNASTRLKKLWEGGYLLRQEVNASSGGAEFVYSRIG